MRLKIMIILSRIKVHWFLREFNFLFNNINFPRNIGEIWENAIFACTTSASSHSVSGRIILSSIGTVEAQNEKREQREFTIWRSNKRSFFFCFEVFLNENRKQWRLYRVIETRALARKTRKVVKTLLRFKFPQHFSFPPSWSSWCEQRK